MGKFNLVSKPDPEPKKEAFANIREIGGTFLCQTCDERVTGAKYSPDTSELAWKCSQEHISYIKEFVI